MNGYLTNGDGNALCNKVGGCTSTNGDTAGNPDPLGSATSNTSGPQSPPVNLRRDVIDGTSNTIILAEHYSYDCLYDSATSPPTMGNRTWGESNAGASRWASALIHASLFEVQPLQGKHSCYVPQAYTPAGCQVAMCDGSVRVAQKGVSAATWWKLLLHNDQQPIPSDW